MIRSADGDRRTAGEEPARRGEGSMSCGTHRRKERARSIASWRGTALGALMLALAGRPRVGDAGRGPGRLQGRGAGRRQLRGDVRPLLDPVHHRALREALQREGQPGPVAHLRHPGQAPRAEGQPADRRLAHGGPGRGHRQERGARRAPVGGQGAQPQPAGAQGAGGRRPLRRVPVRRARPHLQHPEGQGRADVVGGPLEPRVQGPRRSARHQRVLRASPDAEAGGDERRRHRQGGPGLQEAGHAEAERADVLELARPDGRTC